MSNTPKINLIWEWEKTKDKWCRYTKEKNDDLNKLLDKNRTQGYFEENGVKFSVNFVKMVQKNTQTGFERRIRCAVESADEENAFYVWQWLDEKNKWQTFNDKISLDLEKEFLTKNLNSVTFNVSERSYTIDLSKMEQKNDVSGVIRQVRRCKSDAEDNVELPAKQVPAASKRKMDEINPDEKETAPKISRNGSKKSGRNSKSRMGDDEEDEDDAPLVASKKSSGKMLIDTSKSTKSKTKTEKILNQNFESDEEMDEKPLKFEQKSRKIIASDDDDEDDKPLNSLKSESKSTKPKSAAAKKSSANETKSTMRTLVVKGKAPVDPECYQKLGKAHVYYEGNNVYDCMLNQTNVQNNNNKYYMIQLLEDDKSKQYSVWQRWGRVGFGGQNNLVSCGPDLDEAKEVFCKKFFDKTKNEWCDRKKFKKVLGKYDLIEVDYTLGDSSIAKPDSSKKTDADGANGKKSKEFESKLDPKIQKLIKLICDVDAMEMAVREMKFDADKSPLGKLTTSQIKAGYLALKKIEKCLDENSVGKPLVDACNDFYTRIPHCFGMKTPPLIRDKVMLKEKISLLEALTDIEVAIRTLKSETDDDCNPLDRHYAAMKCEMNTISKESEEFKMIEKYLQDTHATTHNVYKMKLCNVFQCAKDGESEQYKDVGNKMLLWHGSRLTNWYGILSQGLRIAPPEAPVTGYMFGKGVYFADISSKSANYCFATKQKNVGLLALCEVNRVEFLWFYVAKVSLGKTNDCMGANYTADKLPPNVNSTKGLGRVAPDPKDIYVTDYGCLVPYGKPKDVGANNRTYALNYNEYVVYDTRQIKMRYLVEIEFVF